MDSLERLRVFTRVVERGSLSQVARDLGLGQPTVSKALQALEAKLGAQLILRSTRRVTVTDAGRRYYLRSKAVLNQLDDAQAELVDDTPSGVLRVHGPVALGELFLAPAAVAFTKAYPAVRCELTCLDAFVDMVAEGADVAIRLGDVDDAGLVRRPLGRMERLLVAAPSYLRARGTPRMTADLAKHASVRFSGLPWGDALTLRRGRRAETVQLLPGFVSNNAIALRQALVGGLGIGVVTRWLVADELRRGELVPVLSSRRVPDLAVNAVFPSGRFIPVRARRFVDLVVERLRGVALFA